MADEFFQRFGAGGVFLEVDAGFFAQDEAEQCLEDAAVALGFAVFAAAAVADEEAARDERLDGLRKAVGEEIERLEAWQLKMSASPIEKGMLSKHAYVKMNA